MINQNGAWIQAQGVSGIEQSDSLWEQIGPAFRIAYAVGKTIFSWTKIICNIPVVKSRKLYSHCLE